MKPHTFVVTVEDQPGVLNRVSSLFRRRNFTASMLGSLFSGDVVDTGQIERCSTATNCSVLVAQRHNPEPLQLVSHPAAERAVVARVKPYACLL